MVKICVKILCLNDFEEQRDDHYYTPSGLTRSSAALHVRRTQHFARCEVIGFYSSLTSPFYSTKLGKKGHKHNIHHSLE